MAIVHEANDGRADEDDGPHAHLVGDTADRPQARRAEDQQERGGEGELSARPAELARHRDHDEGQRAVRQDARRERCFAFSSLPKSTEII